jgi:uncharacterized membrane protein YhaH (DUF805 family)
MKKYYYANSSTKIGPLNLEQLKKANIDENTLVWYEGLENWQKANKIEDLKDLFELNPPPIIKGSNFLNNEENEKIKTERNYSDNSEMINVKQVMFSKSFSFDGRIRRLEYFISFIIFYILINFIELTYKISRNDIIYLINIPLYWFILAQGSKRCHDIGTTGWYQLIPFYVFWMFFQKGRKEINQFGVNPKNQR